MAENLANVSNTSDTNGLSNGAVKLKRARKKQLPAAVNSAINPSEITIKAKVSTHAQSVTSADFPLFKPFVLSQDSSVLYIKTTKNCIVDLSTGNRFSSNTTGYVVIL